MRLWRPSNAQAWAASWHAVRASHTVYAVHHPQPRAARLLRLQLWRGYGLRQLHAQLSVSVRWPSLAFGRGLASSSGSGCCEPGHPHAKVKRPRVDFEAVFLPLLQAFHAREGHSDVPAAYKVTTADAEAAGVSGAVWAGYSLGNAAGLIWARGAFVSSTVQGAEKKAALFGRRRAELAAIDFDTDGERRFGWVVLALEWHGREYQGDMDVPNQYVMGAAECRAAGLPAHVSELRLGQTVGSIRSQDNYVSGRPENRARLEEMGVRL